MNQSPKDKARQTPLRLVRRQDENLAKTECYELLMKHGGRACARELVRSEIEKVLVRWEQSAS